PAILKVLLTPSKVRVITLFALYIKAPLVKAKVLPLAPIEPPTVKAAVLVSNVPPVAPAPLTITMLPVALPVPTVRPAEETLRHVALPRMNKLLLEEPLPIMLE